MRNLIKITAFIIFFYGRNLFAQESRELVLINENTLSRPISLHKGQIRFSSSYEIDVNSSRFDQRNNRIKLREDGLASVRQSFAFDLKYGISDYFQIHGYLSQARMTERGATIYYFPLASPSIDSYYHTKNQGSDKFFITAEGRLPFNKWKSDLLLSGGFLLPSSGYYKHQPDHTTEYDPQYNSLQVIYSQKKGWRSKSMGLAFGGEIKKRFKNWAIDLSGNTIVPLKAVDDNLWMYRMREDTTIEYQKQVYKLKDAVVTEANIRIEFQVRPFLNLFTSLNFQSRYGGWSEEWGYRQNLPSRSLLLNELGYELIITPKLWLRQSVSYGLAGKNNYAPLRFNLTLLYNDFVFKH